MAEVYDRYGRVVYSLIFRVVRDRAAAEDLVQECFLRVWNRVSAFDAEKGALGPWLLTVARNQALDYIRSVEGRAWSTMMTADTERPKAFRDIEGEILNSVEIQRVQKALAMLSDRQREIIELAYFEGLTQTEMAEKLQQPLGTIKTWMRTALKTLREQTGAPAQV
ncbi:MAG: sigma-70 family RNA polymerase sigma factor [Bryobacteraceae bacterium]|nr:sigma-70 family RNA polymerase sigma factor [Bryobacteraceae bacterium]